MGVSTYDIYDVPMVFLYEYTVYLPYIYRVSTVYQPYIYRS